MTRTRSTVDDVHQHAEQSEERIFAGLTRATLDTANESSYADGAERGVSEALVRRISSDKNEPAWMLEHRLKAFKIFLEKPMPKFGADLSGIDGVDRLLAATDGRTIDLLERQTRRPDRVIVVSVSPQDVEGVAESPVQPEIVFAGRGLCRQQQSMARRI